MQLGSDFPSPPSKAHATRSWAMVEGRALSVLHSVPTAWFVVALGLLVIVRNGVHNFKFNPETDPILKCFAELNTSAKDFRCHGPVVFLLPRLLGISTLQQWRMLHAVLTGITIITAVSLALLSLGTGPKGRFAALWISASSMPSVLLNPREHYDVYTVFGGTLLALARSPILAGLGGIILGAANPEQALVAAMSWGIVSWKLRPRRDLAIALLCTLASAVICMTLARLSMHAGDTRLQIFTAALGLSLRVSLQSGTMGIYACHGAAWILVVGWLLLADVDAASRWRVAAGTILISGVITLCTRDGTRVFMCTAWPAFLAFLVRAAEDEREARIRTLTAILLISLAFLPAYVRMKHGVSIPGINAWFGLRGL